VIGLTEFERQLLLKELAEFAALLDELQQRAAQLAASLVILAGCAGPAVSRRPSGLSCRWPRSSN
jgi:hypothetical protein